MEVENYFFIELCHSSKTSLIHGESKLIKGNNKVLRFRYGDLCPVCIENNQDRVVVTVGHPSFNGNINNWNISKVTYIDWMFTQTDNFDQDISTKSINNDDNIYLAWDTKNVEDFALIFHHAIGFNQNIDNWDIRKVNKTAWDYRLSFTNIIPSWY